MKTFDLLLEVFVLLHIQKFTKENLFQLFEKRLDLLTLLYIFEYYN